MSNRVKRALQGVIVAIGAPLGWQLIRWWSGVPPFEDLSANAGLYLYMLFGTMVVFGGFGLLLGSREDRLIAINRELETLAITDALTGLHNARYFYARLGEEFAQRERTGEPLSLVIVDLDFFKRINDEYGHQVGDDVLENTARAIESVARHGETAARVGGEEFALLLPGSTSAEAHDAAERVRRSIGAADTPLPDGRGAVSVTASAGVACTADFPGIDIDTLFRAADDALYKAKDQGRDRTVIATAV